MKRKIKMKTEKIALIMLVMSIFLGFSKISCVYADTSAVVSVTLKIKASDSMSGLSKMMISNYSDFRDGKWEDYNAEKEWTLLSDKGTNKVYIKVKDKYDNVSEPYACTIDLGQEDKLAEVKINDGNVVTNNNKINVSLPENSDLVKMRFSEDNVKWSEWEDYKTTKEIDISSIDGKKTIYVSVKDKNGNIISKEYSDSIVFDETKPQINDIKVTDKKDADGKINGVQITGDYNDNLSGVTVKKYEPGIKDVNYFQDNGNNITGNDFMVNQNGTYTVYAKDAAGNENIATVEVKDISERDSTAEVINHESAGYINQLADNKKLVQTGVFFDMDMLIFIGSLLLLIGLVLRFQGSKKKYTN